jgi:pyridoxine 4-dehydrogenase
MKPSNTFTSLAIAAGSLLAVIVPADAYVAVQPEARVLLQTTPNRLSDTTNVGSLVVPAVGIGTISWSSKKCTYRWSFGARTSTGSKISPLFSDDSNFLVFSLENDDLQDLVNEAYGANAVFLDTAERYGSHVKTAMGMGYGETERMTQQFLRTAREVKGDRPVAPCVASKFTPLPWRTTVQSVIDACEQSRENLGVDQIDLYQVHMPDIVKPFRFLGNDKSNDDIYWDGLAECYHRGLVKNVGVCNYGPTLVAKCQEALAKRGVPLASNQIAYSLLGRHNGSQETLDKCNELGVKVLAYYPFAMGLLTGKYSPETLGSHTLETSSDSSLRSFQKSDFEMKDLERYAKGDGVTVPEGGISPLLVTMDAIANSRGKTVAQVALNYVISKGAIPIPGCRTTSQLQDNLGAMGWRLSETEITMLELEADKLGFGFDGAGYKRTSEKFVGYGTEKWTLD